MSRAAATTARRWNTASTLPFHSWLLASPAAKHPGLRGKTFRGPCSFLRRRTRIMVQQSMSFHLVSATPRQWQVPSSPGHCSVCLTLCPPHFDCLFSLCLCLCLPRPRWLWADLRDGLLLWCCFLVLGALIPRSSLRHFLDGFLTDFVGFSFLLEPLPSTCRRLS